MSDLSSRLKPMPEGKTTDCANAGDGGCITDLFSLLSQSHMMGLLGLLIWRANGPLRFVEIQETLGMSPNTLSTRLKALVEAGLVTRTAHNEIPPRVDYEATPKAHDLKRVFKALHEWAAANTLAPVTVKPVAVKGPVPAPSSARAASKIVQTAA